MIVSQKQFQSFDKELRKADLDAVFPCRACRYGITEILFGAAAAAEQFMNIVCGDYEENPNSLYNRVRRSWAVAGLVAGAWSYEVFPHDLSVVEEQTDDNGSAQRTMGPCKFCFKTLIGIPNEDVKMLVARLHGYNKRVCAVRSSYRRVVCKQYWHSGMAPLVKELRKANFAIGNWGQSKGQHSSIQFANVSDADDFLSIVAGEHDTRVHSLYNRITGYRNNGGPVVKSWGYGAFPYDASVDNDVGRLIDDPSGLRQPVGSPDFRLAVTIEFPAADFDTLVERMSQHNERARSR